MAIKDLRQWMAWNIQQPTAIQQPVQKPMIWPIQKPKIQGRGATSLFSDEQEKYNQMTTDGLDDATARSLISKKRKSLLTDITPDEAKVLMQMQKDWLDSETSVKVVRENRYKNLPLYKKALKIPFDASVWATWLATEQVWNVLDFLTWWTTDLWEQWQEAREIARRTTWDSLPSKIWAGILWAWEMMAVWPTKVAPTLLWRTAQWAATFWAIWAAEPILEKGADVTPWEIAMWWVKWAAIWAVATPIVEKLVAPAIWTVVKKVWKYWTAWIKWATKWVPIKIKTPGGKEKIVWLEKWVSWWIKWFKKSIWRDIKWTKPTQFAKATTKEEKWREFLYEAVNPTKQETKAILKKRADDLIPYIDTKKPLSNTLEKVRERITIDQAKALNSMKNYEKTVWVKWTLKTEPIITKIEKLYKKKVWKSYIDKEWAKFADDMMDTLKWFWKEVKDKDIITIRRAWDKIEKKNKWFMQSAETSKKWEIYWDANKFFREEIKLSNPEYAKFLEKYHKTTTIGDVIQATIDRRVWQQWGWFIRRWLETWTRIMWAWTWWIPWYVASEALIQWAKLLSSPAVKLSRWAWLLKKWATLKSKLWKYGVDNISRGKSIDYSKGGKTSVKKIKELLAVKSEKKQPKLTKKVKKEAVKKPAITKRRTTSEILSIWKPKWKPSNKVFYHATNQKRANSIIKSKWFKAWGANKIQPVNWFVARKPLNQYWDVIVEIKPKWKIKILTIWTDKYKTFSKKFKIKWVNELSDYKLRTELVTKAKKTGYDLLDFGWEQIVLNNSKFTYLKKANKIKKPKVIKPKK